MTNPLKKIKPAKTPTNAIQPPQTTKPTTTTHHTNPNRWQTQANCLGKNHLMFPRKHKDIEYLTEARKLCNTCPVKQPCLQEALQYPAADMHGIWAGLTSRQLAAEQRKQGITPTKATVAALWGSTK